ncbi:LCP family protein [Indiicoccus explosivorum]|uniref:LCP family protein n=1 Tax=Indiicoccus explosivorum TaxID=1917864 RepID=UPI000B431C82|nr:LCP family protein [Indiicoccus explosivorum]
MMEQEFESRSERRRRRKFRWGRLFFLLLIVTLIVTAYSSFQYWNGYHATAAGGTATMEFTGDPVTGTTENILLLGSDARGEENARTDTIMIASWNKETNDIKLISLMRDIYADIPGYEDYKLNTAYYLGGADLLKETISGMFGLEIHHAAIIDFQSFEKLTDIAAPGGVEINVEKPMSEKIGVTLEPGVQKLSGKELLGYARFRADENGDFGRVERQQQVIAALKDELTSPLAVLRYPKLAGAVQGAIETDMSAAGQVEKALRFALFGNKEIGRLTVPVEGSYTFASYPQAGSVLEIDLEANRRAIEQFLSE